ncbi:MAG TPA: PilZ domain-containing protein [Verrucomicrobiae bacterium]|jgi:CheY-like chemotaxis protein/c-di-GMP-binding flagellar brake protein YcgR|nr:PilZ domain-containing protein [Verrucomicrobiae bacterium]
MTQQALLVSADNSAADVLGRVLPTFGIMMDRSSDPEMTLARIQQQKFDALILDFDDSNLASDALKLANRLGSGSLSIALIADRGKVREVLSEGTHFVLYKPLSDEAAKAGLRAAAALLSRERRRAVRVPVQAPVEISLPDGRKADGILLDLSETGMDVLTSEPQVPGALLRFHFELPDKTLELEAHGQVAWANPNGQTGVRFVDLSPSSSSQLKNWLKAAASNPGAGPNETVPHCKLTDLSLGGCYVETDAPFPERALVDLCLKTDELEVHTEGMVRVAHPGRGMGVEFPSRTIEQRAQVGNLISFLRGSPEAMLELMISPRALVADIKQFEPEENIRESGEDFEDPLLDLLRRGSSLHEDDFLSELHQQRSPEDVASV